MHEFRFRHAIVWNNDGQFTGAYGLNKLNWHDKIPLLMFGSQIW